jgi:hypothetical protein
VSHLFSSAGLGNETVALRIKEESIGGTAFRHSILNLLLERPGGGRGEGGGGGEGVLSVDGIDSIGFTNAVKDGWAIFCELNFF